MPDGTKVTATLKNGVTTLPNGDRPPVGAIVHATNGRDYQMQASGSGIEVPKGSTPAAVSTPSGAQAATIKNGVTTMTSTGSRPEEGWIVHHPNGIDYQIDSKNQGVKTTVVAVITTDKVVTKAGYSPTGVTTLLDGSSPQAGMTVVRPNGVAYRYKTEDTSFVVALNNVNITINGVKSTGFRINDQTYLRNGDRLPTGGIVTIRGEDYIMTPEGRTVPYTDPQKQEKRSSPASIPVDKTYNGLIRPVSGTDIADSEDSGIDIYARIGTPIYAVGSGRISYSYYKSDDQWSPEKGYPNDTPYRVLLILDEPVLFNGKEYDTIFYGHLSSVEYEKERGENKAIHVKQGQLIGHSGVGNNAPHLHLAIYGSDGAHIQPSELQEFYKSSNGTVWVAGK